eukprot:3877675-Pleurochrysis_carterae.AAC.1
MQMQAIKYGSVRLKRAAKPERSGAGGGSHHAGQHVQDWLRPVGEDNGVDQMKALGMADRLPKTRCKRSARSPWAPTLRIQAAARSK